MTATGPVGPKASLWQDAAGAWLILAAAALAGGLSGLVWLAGHTASLLAGHGWGGPPYSLRFTLQLLAHGPAPAWPATPPALIWALSVGFAVPPTVLAVAVLVQQRGRVKTPDGLAGRRELAGYTTARQGDNARRLRPRLHPEGPVAAGDAGVLLGVLERVELRGSWEDVGVAVMAPRAGKTTAIAIPAVLDAPGPVVVTSNKADIWTATITERQQHGRCWVFDPQQIVHEPPAWRWNPLAGVTNLDTANRLAGHFIQEINGSGGNNDFWSAAAGDLLAALFQRQPGGSCTMAWGSNTQQRPCC